MDHNTETLKEVLQQLIGLSSTEDAVPYETFQEGIILQQEFLRLVKLDHDILSEENRIAIERARVRLSVYNDLLAISKSLKQTTQQFAAGDGGGAVTPPNYRGMGIKHIQQNRKSENTTNDD
jgi:hypothetical protein